EVLARRRLRRMALKIAHRILGEAGIAGDEAERVGGAHMAGPAPDDDGKLALVVELLGGERPNDRLTVADLAIGKTHEYRWPLRDLHARLLGMPPIVEADAENLAAVGNGRQPLDRLERQSRTADTGGGDFGERAGREHLLDTGVTGSDHAEIHDTAIRRKPETVPTLMAETRQPHRLLPTYFSPMTQADLICEIENSATRTFSQIGKLPIDLFDFRTNDI